jgi:hypothetical protein
MFILEVYKGTPWFNSLNIRVTINAINKGVD